MTGNKMLLGGAVVVVVVLSATLDGCLGTPLCTPDQWEGQKVSDISYEYNHRMVPASYTEKIFYDAKNKKKAIFMTIHDKGKVQQLQILQVFEDQQGMEYTVDSTTGKCYKAALHHPFLEHCIPEGTKELNSYHMGPKSGGMPVTTFQFRRTHKDKVEDIVSIVMKAGGKAIPVGENVFGSRPGTTYFTAGLYGDIEAGISNTTVFEVPKECAREQDFMLVDYLLYRPHILEI